MSGSFFGSSSFGNVSVGYNGQNAAGPGNTRQKGILILFRPYPNQFGGDVGLRPFQYSFDGNFVADVQELTDVTKKGSAPNAALLAEFEDRYNLNDQMMPSFNASMMFQSSRLSEKYRFILILTESGQGLVTGNTLAANVGSKQMRRIYSGYFQDEPYNPVSHGNGRTLNPNAFMVITHKTVIDAATTHGMYGSTMHVNARASEEVINSPVAAAYTLHANADDDMYLMTPRNVVNTIDTTSEGYSFAVPGAESNLKVDRGSHVLSDVLEQPDQNVKTILRGIMSYQDDVTTRSYSMTGRAAGYYDNEFMQDDAMRMTLGRHMDIPRWKHTSSFDLALDTPYSAQTINDMVGGDLDIQDYNQPRPLYYDTADQAVADIINQWSHLIATVVPPILNTVGLNAMQFVYEAKRTMGQPMDQFITYGAESHWPLPNNDAIAVARRVEVDLKKGIFASMLHSLGSFSVEVTANTTGMTVVRLNLIDMGMMSQCDFEWPSCLGGLVSPLIGGSRVNNHNSEQMTGLYGMITGTKTGEAGFNDDDKQFQAMALQQFSTFNSGSGEQFNSSAGYPDILSD
jgi:hypothetical protein